MYQTTYHRPSSVDEAAALFAKGTEAKYLAGGHTLIPVMKQRLASPSDVIDLGKIKDLIGIDVSADAVTIKAATTHYDVATSGPVQRPFPRSPILLPRSAIRPCVIAAPSAARSPITIRPRTIRRRLLALGATIKTNKRSIAADDFSRVCSQPRWPTAKSSRRSASRFRPRRGIQNFPIRRRASR